MEKAKQIKLKYLIALIAIAFTIQTNAQISETQYQKIDSLFIKWNSPNHPGGAIGIMQNDNLIFSKAYGLASMEYLVPNSTGTIFNTGSVSKQFTAMGIVLLHLDGKLSVDDDIRKYMPELPDFGETITIRQMLHHTSGLRSLHAMLTLAGWRDDDARDNADLDRFMLNQTDLNFKPGDEFLYCNTGYMLMVNIIEQVTGEKFPEWMKKNLFEPLGMANTYVEDNYGRIVPNNATSYNRNNEGEFERSVEYWGYVGSGNMHSTTDDLLKWLTNFYNPKDGWKASFQMMLCLDPLNDGTENNYAFGVNLNTINGHKRIQHGGAIGGYRSYVVVFPDQKLSLAILTNFSSSSINSRLSQLTKILLPESTSGTEEASVTAQKHINLFANQLKKYEGSYWNNKGNYVRKIYLKDDTLRYFRSENSESSLVPIEKDEFQMLGVSVDLKIKFMVNGKKKSMTGSIDGGSPFEFSGFEPQKFTSSEMESYTGKFYSPELETVYDVFLNNDTLYYHHSRHGDFPMTVLKKDVFEAEWPFAIAKYKRNENGIITGIFVSNGRVRNLWFEKRK